MTQEKKKGEELMPLRVVVVSPHEKVTAGLAALFRFNDYRVKVIPVTCRLTRVVSTVAGKRPDVVVLRRTWRDGSRDIQHPDPILAAVAVATALVREGFWVVVLDEKWREGRKTVCQLFENAGASLFHGTGAQDGRGWTLADFLLEAAQDRRNETKN